MIPNAMLMLLVRGSEKIMNHFINSDYSSIVIITNDVAVCHVL